MKRLVMVLLALGFLHAGCDSSNSSKETDTKNPPTDQVGQDNNVEPDGIVVDDTKPDPDGTFKDDGVEDTNFEPDGIVGEDSKIPDTTPDLDLVKDTNVEPNCAEKCGEWECGLVDECECGKCFGNDVCNVLTGGCEPTCGTKECGPNGWGGVCGTCEGEELCGSDGMCTVKGDCTTRTYGDKVAKVNHLAIGDGGVAGEALDVDGDVDTCAPESNCDDGLNNQFSDLVGGLSSFFNAQEELDKVINDGSVLLLAEMKNVATDGTPFELNFYIGVAKAPKDVCDFNTATCEYNVDAMSLDPITCEPLIQFANATLTGESLVAGGKDNLFNLSIPVQEGVMVLVTLNRAQIVGRVTFDPVAITDGIIGGALRKDKLLATINALPPELLDELPIGINVVMNMLDTFIVPDVDTDDDDEADAASIGVKFTAIQATILGLEPAAE